MFRRLRCWLLAIACLAPTRAQEPRPPTPVPVPAPPLPQASETSPAALQARLDATTADPSLSAELKASLAEVLGRALESAKAAELQLQAQQRFTAARSSVAARLAQRASELAALEAKKPGPPTGDLKLVELEQGLLAAQQGQIDAQKLAADLDKETARRSERRTTIPTALGELKKWLEALPAQPTEAADADPRVTTARRLALQTERLRLQTEAETLTAELHTYDAEVELLRAERDLAARRTTTAKADTEAWLTALQPLRAAEAQRAEREAQASVVRADVRVVKLANGNADLAKAAAALVEQREAIERDKADRDGERQRLQQEFDEVEKRVELVGSTDAVGLLLRQRRAQLTDKNRVYQQRTRSRRDRIADAQLKSIDFDEQRRQLVQDPETWLQLELGGAAVAESLPGFVIAEARRLRDARRDLLTQLTEGYSALLNTWTDVNSTERQLNELLVRYRAYVAERVLGIRSSPPIWQLDWPAAARATAWLGDAAQWRETWRGWLAALLDDGWPFALLVPIVLLMALRWLMQRRLVVHGEQALRGTNVAYAPTALAAIDTALLALPLPALLWLFGWRLAGAPETTEFGKAVSAGALQAAQALLLVTSLHALIRPGGLAEAHFRWQTMTLARLRSTFPLLVAALVPFAFLLAALELPGEDSWLGSLGGLLMLVQTALLVVALWQLLHPRTGIVGGSVTTTPTALYRFRRVWFLLGAGTPAALLLMVVLGYEYTALQLARRLQLTIAALLLGVFVHALIERGLVLARRRLQMRRAQERLLATKTSEPAAAAAELATAAEPDPQSLARQTQTLLRGAILIAVAIGTFQIWVDVLPALGILRRIELWNGGTEMAPVPVTLANVLLSLFVLLAAVAAARNLPALLELLVLQRLRMPPGERHAISTLARYGIVLVAIVLAFASIGIGWGKVQWLLAAVSVGLGFGLQEVFANFVSGLILLFEQPIRVGDIVTVGTTTGRVLRIRIRATTIQDWERKELVVPNREFVTSRFVNWTLTDSLVRWTVPVGVAYGSDLGKALPLLVQIANESKFVQKEPRPEALLSGFGTSNLELELRLFVDMNTVENRWRSDLLEVIARRFADAGISMAFPQCDVNVTLTDPRLEVVQRADPTTFPAAAPRPTR